eukprot:1739742-Rhodomonas_salina.1
MPGRHQGVKHTRSHKRNGQPACTHSTHHTKHNAHHMTHTTHPRFHTSTLTRVVEDSRDVALGCEVRDDDVLRRPHSVPDIAEHVILSTKHCAVRRISVPEHAVSVPDTA